MLRQLQRFGGVGLLAAAVHYLSCLLFSQAGVPPLLANVGAFLVAFQVSYFGHRHLSFEVSDLPHRQTLPRFFAVAVLGFMVNELLFWLALTYTALPYQFSLGVIILLVAAMTFALSRAFAFARPATPR